MTSTQHHSALAPPVPAKPGPWSNPWAILNHGLKDRTPFAKGYHCIPCGNVFYEDREIPLRYGIVCPFCQKGWFSEGGPEVKRARRKARNRNRTPAQKAARRTRRQARRKTRRAQKKAQEA